MKKDNTRIRLNTFMTYPNAPDTEIQPQIPFYSLCKLQGFVNYV